MKSYLSMVLAAVMVLSLLPLRVLGEETAMPAETQTEAPELRTEEASDQTEPEYRTSVTFLCSPQDLQLKVYAVLGDSREEVMPQEGRTYELLPGTYAYDASAEGSGRIHSF